MSAEHEQALAELFKFRAQVLELHGRIRDLPPEPSRSAIGGGGTQTHMNRELPPATDSRAILDGALRDVLRAIDGYLQSREWRRT
jgi:hypothetical protein